jgi:hypothetical protein
MDAVVRNENEKELLIIFKEVISSLGLDIEIESEALAEGGLKNIWKFIGKNSGQLSLIVSVIALIISLVPDGSRELTKLQIESTKLDIELKKQELRKLKEEVTSSDAIDSITGVVTQRVINILSEDYKILWHKSNFYRRTNFYLKVDKISTLQLNENNTPVGEEKTVVRNDFNKFIIRSNELPSTFDEEAVIDLISPVLKKGKFQWKGYYKGEIISFKMKDDIFKDSVLNSNVEFSNGVAIKCVLQQDRKIDEVGLIKITQNSVLTVIEVITNQTSEMTPQGEKYIRDKKLIANQLNLGL